MEVKTGRNHPSPERRRKDFGTGRALERNIDWGQLPTDIDLYSQSPLTIAGIITSRHRRIRLLPAPESLLEQKNLETHTHIADLSDKVTPIYTRFHRQSSDSLVPANDVNDPIHGGILTLHDHSGLKDRCRRVVVENALVKNRHEKQLYLAVGMLRWSSDPVLQMRHESPLLFFPVTLLSENNIDDGSPLHILNTNEGIPEINHHLREQFATATGTTLPLYTPEQTLDTFFERVDASLVGVADAQLQPSMRLGLAAAPAGLAPGKVLRDRSINPLPARFDHVLAATLLTEQTTDELRVTLHLLQLGSHQSLFEFSEEDSPAFSDLGRIRKLSSSLHRAGLDNIEFRLLPNLPLRINDWIKDLEPVIESELVCNTLEQADIKAIDLMKLAGIIEMIDKAPEGIDTLLHRDLAFRGTPLLFKRARHQALLIEDELSQLQQHFHLDRLPAKSQLLHLIEELGGAHNSDIEVVDSHYFSARRQFMNFSTDKPTSLSDEHRRLLNKLVKVLRFRELFVNNTEYRLALGPAYRGLKTDWHRLETLINYVQELRQVLGSEAIAGNAIANWPLFRKRYVQWLERLQHASGAVRALLQVIRPMNHSATASELILRARDVAEQLLTMNIDYRLITGFGHQTAAQLLRLFTDSPAVDNRTETLIGTMRTRIRSSLRAVDEPDQVERITSTLQWLQSAVDHPEASSAQLLEHLNDLSRDAPH